MAELNDLDKRVIETLAVCNLKPTEASRVLYMHRNTVIYHIEKITRVTGLDPLCFYDMIKLLEDIQSVPAADVAPVVHGEWVVSGNYYGDNAKCSACGHEMCVNEPGNGLMNVVDLHYCPNCGAKMDGGKPNEEL